MSDPDAPALLPPGASALPAPTPDTLNTFTLDQIRARVRDGTLALSQQARRRIQHPTVSDSVYRGVNGYGDYCYDLLRVTGPPRWRVYLHAFTRTTPAGAHWRATVAPIPPQER